MSRPKVYDDIPDVSAYKPNVKAFYKFMYERHMIWHERFVLKSPPPWTNNKILRDYKFTNVYRELDRGTIWYRNHVFTKAGTNFYNLIWLTTMYRLLNRVETFEKVGLVNCYNWDEEKKSWKKKLQDLHKTESIFTSAHLTLPTHTIGKSKIETYMEVLNHLHRKLINLCMRLKMCMDLEELFEILMEIPCVGRFISYEICCDLILVKAVPFTENDWVNPGPGCKTGLRLMFPRCKTISDFQSKIRFLASIQEAQFQDLGLEFPYLNGKRLSLRSIEHSLCEFSKYMKMKTGIGKQRMKFKPKDWNNSYGQITFKFSKETK